MKSKIASNIIMLYILNITQLVLPLLTLPYLARVLSVEAYGIVTYMKSVNTYMLLIIEFGFLLSGTKAIVEYSDNKHEISKIVTNITVVKLFLALVSFIILSIMIFCVPILKHNPEFALISFLTPFLSIFLYDYLFRGLEMMHIVTIRYLIMKGTSTLLTFVVIKSNDQLLLVPLLDAVGSLLAAIWVMFELKKIGISFRDFSINECIKHLKVSFTYFISSIATTAFGALNTFLVGIYLESSQVAYWGILMTLIGAIQAMYSPIGDGIYPRMVATKNLRMFLKILMFFVPLLLLGATVLFFGANLIMTIVGGQKYEVVTPYLRSAIPLIVISFFSILFGWPVLGAIGKVKEVTITTVTTALLQVVGLVLIIRMNNFSIYSLLLVRTLTEMFMACFRVLNVVRFRKEFN